MVYLFKYDQVIFSAQYDISRSDEPGLRGGLIDMWLLSQSDDIIVSSASTFGRISYGMKGISPLSMNRRNECRRKTNSQPCFFKWKMYSNQCIEKRESNNRLFMENLPNEIRELVEEDCDYI